MVVTEKIVENLVSKLFELLQKEYGLQKGVRDKIKGLSRELGSVRAVLSKIGGVPSDQLDEQVRLWVCDIREASYDMEDILDAFLVDHVRRPDEPADKNLLKRLLKKLGKLFQKSKDHRKFSTLIEDISKKLEEVAARRGRYTVDTIVARPAAATTIDPRLLHLYKRASELVGIEKPRDELINKLSLGHDDDGGSDKKMKIVSVFGFGGLGKTTLVKAVYDHFKPHFKCRPSVQLQVDQDPDMNSKGIDDQLLKPHLECGAFVPVGRNPDVKKVFRDILIDLDKQKYTNLNMKEWDEKHLMDDLSAFIKEKRFFIVIDDIWDKDSWKLIRCALQESHYESRLVITTRIFEVATYAGEVYRIQPLSGDNSEKLLYARIADSEGKYFYSPSAEACDKILKKCGGVPLSIITIASLLASKPDEEWSEVYNSIGFGHEDNDDVDNTRKILAFSYYDLPPHLKPCLLYLSIFPENDVIEKNSLIWKWAAEGFIVIPKVQAAAGVGLFELGERYFNELINRSMIMPKESHDGYIDACSVHDMVLDFIHSLPSNQDVVAVLEGNEQQVPPGTIARRLALRSVRVHDGCQLANIAVEKVRSLTASQCIFYESWPHLPVLRVLDMVNCVFQYYFYEGVEEDCNKGMLDRPSSLRHLRYLRLELEDTHIPELTGEIRYLKFLQTLDLWDFDVEYYELPEEVGLLTQFVCLRVQPYTTVPTGVISKLTSLQELWIKYHSEFYEDNEYDAAMMHFVKELGLLRELRVLRTKIIFGSESTAIASLESLGNLHSIRELLIEGSPLLYYNGENSDARSVSYRHLRVLRLHCFSGLPAWIKSSLAPNLSYLKVTVQVVKEQDMETLARLPELRCLVLKLELELDLDWYEPEERDCGLVVSIKIHVGYFRKLRILRIAGTSIWFDLLDNECNSSGSSKASSNNIMPSLESLEFDVDVRSLKAATQFGFHKLIGFDNLGRTSLQSVTTTVDCRGARASEAEEVEAALLTAAAAHPKHPTFQARWQEENLISPYQESSWPLRLAKTKWIDNIGRFEGGDSAGMFRCGGTLVYLFLRFQEKSLVGCP
ncbi:hypothetical protein BS78_09G056100 [Paspalum vaginatum]|nr:hypothetical protein BS78_09G056100 [Paspalum vaginatum]